MTRDEIIRLMDWHPSAKHTDTDGLLARIKKVAEAAAAAERERACRIVTGLCISDNNAREIREAIRARGKK